MLTDKKLFSAFLSIHKIEIFLACCWLCVQGPLFYHHGIVTEFEATKYIAEADNILATGTVSSPNFWLYSTQIFLIAAAKKIHTGFISVVIVQWLFNLVATWVFYKFSTRISNKATGLLITFFFIFTIPLQTFNCFLQTESLFYSFTILFSCYLLSLQKLTGKNSVAIILFLLLISFTRPTGILWIPCTFLFLFFRFFRTFSFLFKIGITLLASVVFIFFLNNAISSGGEFDLMLPFRDEMIICGVPTLPHSADIKISDSPNSLQGLAYYINHNFDQFIRMAWLRSKAFFGLSRTYYSNGHNIYLILYFYPFYVLLILGTGRWFKQNKHLLLYCFSLIFLIWSTVILTCDDWHNRFFLSILPYIYMLSIPALKNITNKIRRTR